MHTNCFDFFIRSPRVRGSGNPFYAPRGLPRFPRFRGRGRGRYQGGNFLKPEWLDWHAYHLDVHFSWCPLLRLGACVKPISAATCSHF